MESNNNNNYKKKNLSPIIPKLDKSNLLFSINDLNLNESSSLNFLNLDFEKYRNNTIKICCNSCFNIINKTNINNNYEARLGIAFGDLKYLKKGQLINLIIFMVNSCSFTLKNKKNFDLQNKRHDFKIVKNKENNWYDIITSKSLYNNNELKNWNKIQDDKVEANLIEYNNNYIHPINSPIYCDIHDKTFDIVKEYLIHCEESHTEFICFECGEKFKNISKFKSHIHKMITLNKNNNYFNKDFKNKDKDYYNDKDYNSINNKDINYIKENYNYNSQYNNTKNENNKCIVCGQNFSSTEILIEHFYEIHDVNINEDFLSKDIVNKYNKWIENIINKTEKEKAIPNGNRKIAQYKENNFMPIKEKNKKEERKTITKFYCKICDKYFHSKNAKKMHKKKTGHDEL